MNVNSLCIDMTLGNENDLGVDETPVNMNGPDVNKNRIDWTLPHIYFPYYRPPFLGQFGSFSGACRSSPTPNLSLVCITAPAPYLFHHIARALKHLISFSEFGTTLHKVRPLFLLFATIIFTPLMPLLPPSGSRKDPTKPLSAWLPECLSDIFSSVSLS